MANSESDFIENFVKDQPIKFTTEFIEQVYN